MKKHLLAGLVFVLPLAVSLWICWVLLEVFTEPLMPLMEKLLPFHLQQVFARILALCALLLVLYGIGWTAHCVGKKISTHPPFPFLQKVPLVRGLYPFFHDITYALLQNSTTPFDQTVLIPFPKSHTFAVGLALHRSPSAIQKARPEIDTSVFIPTAPHPISGLLLLTEKANTIDIEMTTEEALAFIISCGTLADSKKKSLPS